MSRQIETDLRRVILKLVREEAGVNHGDANPVWVRVEAGASAPKLTEEATPRGRRQTTLKVGERWLVDRVDELVGEVLKDLGCMVNGGAGTHIFSPFSEKDELLDTQIKNHLQHQCTQNGKRIENALLAENIQTYRQFVGHDQYVPGIGKILRLELEAALAQLGLRPYDGGEAS